MLIGIRKKLSLLLWIRIHTLPRFFIERWQLGELKKVIADAYKNIPPYKALCDELGAVPCHIRALDDIRKFPTTSKALFRGRQLEKWLDQRFSLGKLDWQQTSGSTGEPFCFPLNIHYYFEKKFPGVHLSHLYVNRYLHWLGFSAKHVMENIKMVEIRMQPTSRGQRHYLHIPTPDLRECPLGVFEKLSNFKPDVIESRPTLLVELARLSEQNLGTERINFPFAYTHGELLIESQRKYLKEVFGCEVYSRYGLQECWGVAIECPAHSGLHINEESFIIEILDERNRPLPDGQYGRIIVTVLYNRTLPFIRYETGDQGMITPGKCSCGLWTKRLIVRGRAGGFFSLGNRRFNFAEFQMAISDFHPFILRYQLAKVGENMLELRIIPAKEYTKETADRIQNEFKQKFNAALEIKPVSDIPYPQGGKTRFIIDETATQESH